MRKLALLLIGIALALPIILAQVQIQTFISFQGKLANASTGDPMTPASLRINVTEYNNLSAVVWGPVIYNNATDFQGIFDIVLGRNSTLNLTPGKDYQIIVCVDQDAVTYAACDFVYGDGTASGGLIIANAGGIRDASQLFLIDNSTSVQEIINQIITNISNIQGGMSHFFVDTGDIATQNLTTAIILNVSDLYAKTLNVTGNVNVTGAINAYNISNFNARIISLNSSTLLKAVQNNTDFIPNTLNITRIGITSLDGGSVNLVADQRADPLNQMTLYAESQSYDYSVRNIGVYGKGVLDYAAINGNQLTIGVLGNASNNVEATGTGYGVMGIAYYQGGAPYSFGTGAGVYGTSDNLYGVQGVSSSNYGVIGQSTSSYSGYFTLGRGVLIDRSLNVSNGLTVDSGTLYVNAGKNVVNITGDLGVSGTVFAHNYSSNSPITFSNASNGERLAVIDYNGNLRVITGGLCV
ncbi:hypothetical protein J4464_03635, partial [Candidatus Woesearchaeota archaeon]|nr:hypothetical protein [Candidatus Woesearchaeota archaeon]